MQNKICGETVRGPRPLKEVLVAAVEAIRTYEYASARELLREASSIDMENPEIYNLLGITYEKEGDYLKASKFYRVAYYMDQTFVAPSDNLERISVMFHKNSSNINWGFERIGGELT